jgi:hypothetical protein
MSSPPVSGAPEKPRPTYYLARRLFLRLLGLVYLIAFISVWAQVKGLIGSRGILPIQRFLEFVQRVFPGWERFCRLPTLCWLDSSDHFLIGLCAAGTVLSCLAIAGLGSVSVFFWLWVSYLSLVSAGQNFFVFQWDTLLLESGFLAVFWAPMRLWPRRATEQPPSRVVHWLLRWLLFRLMLGSGAAKVLSGDATWQNLTALGYHYETQPLPMATSWYMHQLPGWFQAISVLVTFTVELVLPILIWGPRRWRVIACAGMAGFQVLIAATGNYGFFNLLTVVLCVPLLDDGCFPQRWRASLPPTPPRGGGRLLPVGRDWLTWPLAAAVLVLSAMPVLLRSGLTVQPGYGLLGPAGNQPHRPPLWVRVYERCVRVYEDLEGFHAVNQYGLFASMTTSRPEIIVEGSDDGQSWRPYRFRWKPGDLDRRPSFTWFHMPRLDWQMWFAALGKYHFNPWFMNFEARLLEGSPDVLALLEENPFPDKPPRMIRATVYDYHFSEWSERRATGAWWRRQGGEPYCPVMGTRAPRGGQRE